jgi:hypothetical protein
MPKTNLPFKINSKKLFGPVKKFLIESPWFVAKRSFVLFWVIFVMIALIDGYVYYKYLWKVNVQKIEVAVEQVSINDEAYNKFLENYAARKKVFSRGHLDFHNIFFR